MYRDGQKGSITVFLSLTCILFLALICTVIESARVQGAKAQTANILGMGNVSLLGEFEKELLERYEVRRCFYGHLHSESHKLAVEGLWGGVEYRLVSADYIGFKPVTVIL